MTSGPSMPAMTLNRPPHARQVSSSMAKSYSESSFPTVQRAFVEAVEAGSFAGFHAKLLINRPGTGKRELIRDAVLLPLLSGFVQQVHAVNCVPRRCACCTQPLMQIVRRPSKIMQTQGMKK